MNDNKISNNKNNNTLTAGIILGALLMATPVFFIENEQLSGICGISALLIFEICARNIQSTRQYLCLVVALWLSYSVRFSTLYGTDPEYMALIPMMCLPIVVFGSVNFQLDSFLGNINIKNTKTNILSQILQIFIFPLTYTLLHLFLVSFNMGNITNLTVYAMLLPKIARNLSWLGEFGMTFVICLMLSLLAECVISEAVKVRLCSAASCVLVLSCLLIYGTAADYANRQADYSLHVAVAVREKMGFVQENSDLTEEEQFMLFQNAVETAAGEGADLLVLCEEFCSLKYEHCDETFAAYAEVIRKYNIPVLIGAEIMKDGDERNVNKAVFYDADGTVLCDYIKNNLVPFVESEAYEDGPETPGILTCTIGGHEVNIAVVLCFDINDSVYLRKIPDNTELLIAPSWDWDSCNIEQKRTRIRSIERNTTLLTHCYEGFTFVSGPYGLCGDYIDFREEYGTVRMIEVPVWEKDG